MAWAWLSTTIDTKPRVLAGPLLRKVTPETATVWLALRKPGRVTLKVLDPGGLRMLEGTRHTIAVGAKLHIVAVTATRQPPAAPLVENVVYRYDLTFAFDDNLSTDLGTATGNALLAYPPFDKPTFCLPPKDLNSLRLMHSSCRMPHGNGTDALPLVGQLLSQTAATPLDRPQQLLLMGDQIYADDVTNLKTFAGGLVEVRRVLANIPSYMICDDHEVTDDWNMTLDICVDLYGNPLGRRVVKNGVVAYSLCQHWGNAPEHFAEANPSLPGTTMLKLLDGGTAATYDANSLIFNYTVEGPGHQVIVTDTRTWRSFPRGGGEAPDLLPQQQFADQIHNIKPDTAGRALLVVITTNAPPVEPIRSATRHDWIANHAEHFPDIHEAWVLPAVAFDRLVKSVTDRLPTVANELRGPVILLSGDVHIAFASRMLYKATARYEDAKKTPATAVIAQLVASSLRKQTDSPLALGTHGYTYAPRWFAKPLIGPHVTEFYAGWEVPSGSQKVAKRRRPVKGGTTYVSNVSANRDRPTLRIDNQIELSRTPDYLQR
jgi:hypothetical protein